MANIAFKHLNMIIEVLQTPFCKLAGIQNEIS